MSQQLQKKFNAAFTVMITCVIFINANFGQSGIVTTGGNVAGASGSVSYSVGQVFYLTHESATGTVHEGLQQAYEIFTVDIPGIVNEFDITLFPNPAQDHLVIRVADNEGKNLRYQIYSASGQMMVAKNLTGTETNIEVEFLPPSTYIIHILSDNKTIKTFKLIKHSR